MGTVEISTHNQLSDSRRVIVKIVSALLVDDDKGEIRGTWLSELASDIAGFRKQKIEVVIVSSGAIAVG